jgi:hypothetical protein
MASAVLYYRPAAAHVLLSDTSHRIGAILHIDPGDDPIAGQPSTIILLLQQTMSVDTGATLHVSGIGIATDLPMHAHGQYLSARYTFPAQGQYTLRITFGMGSSHYTFVTAQRVTQGVAGDETALAPEPWWAIILLALSSSLLLVLGIVFYSQFPAIAQRSKM